MSWRHTLAAGLLPVRNPTLKSVLLALGHHANDYTGTCWPSIDRLALFTGLARRTVQQAIRDAAELELISITERRGKPNSYMLKLPHTPIIDQAETGGASPAPLPLERGAADDVRSAPPAPKSSKNKTLANANDEIDMEKWVPLPDTVQRIMKEDRLSQSQIDDEARLFRLSCMSGTVPARPDPAFRLWCARRKDLKGKSPPSGPRAPAPPADRRTEVLRLIDEQKKLIPLYEKMGRDFEIEREVRPRIVRLEHELTTLPEGLAS